MACTACSEGCVLLGASGPLVEPIQMWNGKSGQKGNLMEIASRLRWQGLNSSKLIWPVEKEVVQTLGCHWQTPASKQTLLSKPRDSAVLESYTYVHPSILRSITYLPNPIAKPNCRKLDFEILDFGFCNLGHLLGPGLRIYFFPKHLQSPNLDAT